MPFHWSAENRLLLSCVQVGSSEPQKIRDLIRLNIHWERLVERAMRNSVAPLLYSNLKQLTETVTVPMDTMSQLKGVYLWHVVHNRNLYHKLHEILELFGQESIPVLVLKGAVLAWLFYDNIALRPMGDLDLLVKRGDLD